MFDFISPLYKVRKNEPLVQCIANFVTVNDCANIILAAGGSPSMSQDIREVEESVCLSDALVCNMPLSMEFPRQEYWSGLTFPSLGDLPDPGIQPTPSALAGRFFTTEPPAKSMNLNWNTAKTQFM